MGAQSVTTGSTVMGLVAGLPKHMGGGCVVMYVDGNPSGVVTPYDDASVTPGVSGACLAFDTVNNILYKHVSGDNFNVWNQIGSQSFS